jgi:hypothetical protein
VALTQLTHLHLQRLQWTEWTHNQTMQLLQQLLTALAGLQQLQHLHAWLPQYNPEAEAAMQWTALVASTQLTLLNFAGVELRPGNHVTNAVGWELETPTDGW